MEPNDNTLAQQARDGSEHAATELVNRFYRPIYAYLRRSSGAEHDAADLTQKTFMQVWRALPKFQARSEFKTWLYRIAHHTYVDWVRGQTRQKHRDHSWWEGQATSPESALKEFQNQELAQAVYELVDQMTEPHRQAIHLHYYQQLTLQQTADVLEVSLSTVKNRLREALEQLRQKNTTENPLNC